MSTLNMRAGRKSRRFVQGRSGVVHRAHSTRRHANKIRSRRGQRRTVQRADPSRSGGVTRKRCVREEERQLSLRQLAMTSRTFTKVRLLYSAARQNARLVNSSLSISPDLPVTAPPPPPRPVPSTPAYADVPRPPGLSASSKNGKDAARTPAQATTPEVAHKPGHTTRTDDGVRGQGPVVRGRAAAQTSHQGSDELASAVALDLFLLRTLSQLEERAEVGRTQDGAMIQPPLQKDWASLQTLLQQQREREGDVVEGAALEYEPTPPPSRRIRLDGRAGLEEGAVGAQEEQDGVVVVAHVLGGRDTRVSISSGFAIGRTHNGEGQMILTCAHTLASVSCLSIVHRSRTSQPTN